MIKITLFGEFRIEASGQDATQSLGNSKKGRLMLEYLILHRDEAINSADLYEVLWPNEDIANPESALKTLVSRTRSALSRSSALLDSCIITSRGSYRFNTALDHAVDVFEFETLAKKLLQIETLDDASRQMLWQAISLYTGDLCTWADSGSWIVTRSAYYHALFIQLAHHAISLLKQGNDLEGIVQIARKGLAIDMLDETLHLELMRALTQLRRSTEALSHYRHAQDIYFTQYGLRLPEKIQSFYRQIIQVDQSLEMDVDSLKQSLHQTVPSAGSAFVCEYAIFKDVYQPLVRNLLHLGQSVHLAIIMLATSQQEAQGGKAARAQMIDRAMNDLLTALTSSLPPTDVISRYSHSQYVLLMPDGKREAPQARLDAIASAFQKRHGSAPYQVKSKLYRVDNA